MKMSGLIEVQTVRHFSDITSLNFASMMHQFTSISTEGSLLRCNMIWFVVISATKGAQWLSGRVLDSRPKGRGFEPHRRHCVVSLSKNINPSLVLVQPRKTRPFITERLLMGRKESNQTNNICD